MENVASWIENVLDMKRNQEPVDSYDWAQIQGYIHALEDIQGVVEANRD